VTGGRAPVRHLQVVPRTPDGQVDLDRIVAALGRVGTAATPGRVAPRVLESVQGVPATGRWSYVVAAARGRVQWWPGAGATTTGALTEVPGLETTDPLAALEAVCRYLSLSPHGEHDPDAPPFSGGLVGGFSYDLARTIETIPARAADDRALPWLDLAVADLVVAIDHDDQRAVLVERPVGRRREDDEVAAVIDAIAAAPELPRGGEPAPAAQVASTSLSRPRYLAAVRAILGDIAAGDTFQVNLSQRLSAQWPHDVVDLYRALRRASPAPYGAIVPAGSHAVASISPETFLHIDHGTATVRPIKGTRPRHRDAEQDLALRDELAGSAKDRAENVMVVDMERNDLGRVCIPGSVTVPVLCSVEGHPTVWHLVSEVTGALEPGSGYADVLRAAFPCGSVTGTPKVKAMELIERYEPVQRGWYCGALGFLADGAASLSVAIRTAVLSPEGRVDYGAGSGIVADSDPDAEHDESLDKAAAFLQAVGATAPPPT